MREKRPVYLNLLQIKLPCPALVSILHRLSGVIVFLLLPLLLCLLSQSLRSADSFASLQRGLAHPVLRFFIWVALSSLAYHLIAGIRHLLMDVGFGESLQGGRWGSYLVLAFSALCIVLLGVWLW